MHMHQIRKWLLLLSTIKRQSTEHPEIPPARIMRILQEAPSTVLAQLPERQNIKKTIQRERSRNFPTNPRLIGELAEIPERYRKTLEGVDFLLYDSFEDQDYTLPGRVIIFATQDNLRTLFKSKIWFADGTFSTVPTIFFQLFTVMGSVVQGQQTLVFPLVYALLENKEQATYAKVFEVLMAKAEDAEIQVQHPQRVMTDFELAIVNPV